MSRFGDGKERSVSEIAAKALKSVDPETAKKHGIE